MNFWDSSALIPLLLREQMSTRLRTLHARDRGLVVWWASRVECTGVIARLNRESRLDESEAAGARQRLRFLFAYAEEIAPGAALRGRAERLLNTHPMSTADALQLAAALVWASEQPTNRGFVALDRQLRRAAGREGFDVLPSDPELA